METAANDVREVIGLCLAVVDFLMKREVRGAECSGRSPPELGPHKRQKETVELLFTSSTGNNFPHS